MKTLLRFLVAASLLVVAGSIYIGQRVSDVRSESFLNNRSDDYDDTGDRIEKLHLIAKIPSVVFFVAAMVAFFMVARNPSLPNGLRLVLRITSVVCLAMTAWSLLLSGRVSMDEVMAAWIVAGLLVGILSFMLLRRGQAAQAVV